MSFFLTSNPSVETGSYFQNVKFSNVLSPCQNYSPNYVVLYTKSPIASSVPGFAAFDELFGIIKLFFCSSVGLTP
jgi:hypothetical protein